MDTLRACDALGVFLYELKMPMLADDNLTGGKSLFMLNHKARRKVDGSIQYLFAKAGWN